MKCVIAAGGTGGHLFPGLAVAEVLQERGHEVAIFISEKEIDALATRDRSEFRFERLPSIGMPPVFSPAMVGFLRKFFDGLGTCRAFYRKWKPDTVLGMGGFTSTAPILAGKMRRVPTFVHESNAIPGKANRLNAKMVNAVLLGFEECRTHFSGRRCEVVGTPIRRTLATRLAKEEALAKFSLTPDRKTLLVMGGSQGAHGINEAMMQALPQLREIGVQIIHLTGTQDEQVALANYRRAEIPAHVAAFSSRMEEAYSAADLAIARSGAASMAELAHFRLPSILVPYPFAAEDHQARNAEVFARAGAAEVMKESEITGESLAARLKELLNDSVRLEQMATRCAQLAPGNAAARVVDTMEAFLN
jgi:UDP-N-acetylglucosamine--N-acetylmuramyl-(pentapeptide) pyrophosphoryl-undecaprenol N-acetylglucosamine transferase